MHRKPFPTVDGLYGYFIVSSLQKKPWDIGSKNDVTITNNPTNVYKTQNYLKTYKYF